MDVALIADVCYYQVNNSVKKYTVRYTSNKHINTVRNYIKASVAIIPHRNYTYRKTDETGEVKATFASGKCCVVKATVPYGH